MTETAPKIKLPPYRPPSPDELRRRQTLGEEIRRLRAKLGPIDTSVTELIRQIREES